jgi:DNA-3-methyladenine glycosylase II
VNPDDVLARDPVMARLIAEGGPLPLEPDGRGRPDDYYGALVRSIAGQQLSVKAARAIWNRLIDRYEGRTPKPEEILAEEPEEFRAACGFSRAKVASLRSLAEHVIDGRLELGRLEDLDDATVIEELVAVKGIGVWTAQMFLMFTLHRPDILPVGDLGVRNAAMRAYGLEKPPAPDELTALAEAWRPHRTRASLYLWRSLDNVPTA